MTNWIQNIATAEGLWTESRKQWVFAGVLILLGLAAFVEVVLMPGALFRHPVATTATDPASSQSGGRTVSRQESQPKVGVVESLLESAETKRLRAEASEAAARKSIKNRLAETQAELTDARTAAGREWQQFVGEVQRRHQVKLDAVPFDARSQPRELNQVILSNKTAAAAWASIRNLGSQANTEFGGIDASMKALDRRLEQDSFGESDGQRQQALLAAVQAIRGRIKQAYRDLDHIDVQVRAKNFLFHNSTERREQ